MATLGTIAVELTVGLFGLLLLTKVMGRASMSEATPFDFISMIVVGDFVSDAIYDPQTHIWKVLFAIFFWGVLIFLIDFITLKFHRSRFFFESRPAIVIRDGIIDRDALSKNKVDMNHLQMMLRDRDIFSMREVDFAVLEPNGKVSVIRKPSYETVQRGDLHLHLTGSSVPVTLISDGVVIKKGLKEIGKSEQWLRQQLSARSVDDPRRVLIAEWQRENGLFVQKMSSR
ncbi:MAG: DUF421 domain-containing protein [Sporolactobacillus sp.]|jgi:uncharacterized membrane protein YcaP (DUF421 family)|nr:DUF421 domain-containing protein [Sporolactobacillus sp.]